MLRLGVITHTRLEEENVSIFWKCVFPVDGLPPKEVNDSATPSQI